MVKVSKITSGYAKKAAKPKGVPAISASRQARERLKDELGLTGKSLRRMYRLKKRMHKAQAEINAKCGPGVVRVEYCGGKRV